MAANRCRRGIPGPNGRGFAVERWPVHIGSRGDQSTSSSFDQSAIDLEPGINRSFCSALES
jgi:hypothetical protein